MKTDNIHLRVSAEEKAAWEQAARDQGMTLSQWLRWLATINSKK